MTRGRLCGVLALVIGIVVVVQVLPSDAAVDSAHGGSGRLGALYAVAALSPSDVWAVGYAHDLQHQRAFTEHWDGSRWQAICVPHPRQRAQLFSVSAIATDNVWAVGYSGVGQRPLEPLVLHWDGDRWSATVVDGLDGLSAFAVSGDAPDDVWVVGGSIFGGDSSFIEHWDGASWSRVTNPSGATLRSVFAVTSTDAWSVGYLHKGRRTELTVAEHWDGQHWTRS